MTAPEIPAEKVPISLSELRQLGSRAGTYTVPIVSPSGLVATGTLFQIGPEVVLVSAAHNEFQDKEDRRQIRLPSGRRITLRGQMGWFQPERGVDPDVVAYRLRPETVEQLGDSYPSLTLDDVARPNQVYLDFMLLAGYTAEKVRQTGTYQADWFLTTSYTGSTEYFQDPVDPDTHLTLAFSHSATSLNDLKVVPSPELFGISGAAVWQGTPAIVEEGEDRLWLPSERLKVVGVQTAVSSNKKWIRATLWSQIAGLLTNLVPEAAEDIRERFCWDSLPSLSVTDLGELQGDRSD